MNIVHVSPHLPPDQAANALLPAQLGQWLAARGHTVAFVAHDAAQGRPQVAGHMPQEDEPSGPGGLPVKWIPRRGADKSVRRLLKLDAWQLVRRLGAALHDVAARADVLHLHSNGLIIEAAARWATHRRKPYLLTLYGTEIWHYRKRRPVDPFARAYAGAAAVTFYSQRLLERARELGLSRGQLSVVYPAVSLSFQPRARETREAWRLALGITEPYVVVNVKRLHPLAGQRYLLDAFARACGRRRDVRLIICGEGALRQELADQARTLGVADRVTLTGLLPNEAIARYVAVADLFVLPSLLEALPTVAVEALASGTPVISADHPGGVELHGIFGDDVAIVPREQVEPLARAIDGFLAAPRRTTTDTATALERLFRAPAVITAFSDLYGRMVGARS